MLAVASSDRKHNKKSEREETKVGEMSGIVETDSGFHLILRTA